uniref:Deacetylase sirtuin-type domain-containing protein n=1 Tax=Noctiluca scintillans TaxID=2966 RepID=A0A7S1A9R1_NOCSC|eukprot:CAMPEP_0194515846 /NCGR_PEP_ID=MMETSP0253-20130528/48616_1 /TAXON_ID=2966 /ORGANISM="Noctiluca scintillans" /LENGTH=264 /DNA_ID=CAMNT_0039359633 /DNA_START=8 /DNA_END=802 /DNA_ORIENTATION=+
MAGQREDVAMTQAVEAIGRANRCVVFSGAGCSADSGIGTFRGAGGAWGGCMGKIALVWGGTPVGWRWTPGLVWYRFVQDFYGPIVAARPHDGLFALAELQQTHFVGGRMQFVTMNVDSLHQMAGSQEVSEVHGSVQRFRCAECDAPVQPPMPLNPRSQPYCQCGGRVRPDVTLFTEGLPPDQWSSATDAIRKLKRGDVLIIVGTSSVVYPAASLPEIAKQRGVTLIEFNLELPTPLSELADIQIPGRATETLRHCVDRVLRRMG